MYIKVCQLEVEIFPKLNLIKINYLILYYSCDFLKIFIRLKCSFNYKFYNKLYLNYSLRFKIK